MRIDGFEVRLRKADVDPNCLGFATRNGDRKRDGVGILRIGHDGVESRRRGNGQPFLDHTLDVKLESLRRHVPGLFKRATGGDAARKIREVDAEVAVRVLAQKSDVGRQRLPPPDCQAGLPLDALNRADRDIFLRVWNGHAIRPIWMPKLMMAALHAHAAPTGRLELADDCPAVHAGVYDAHGKAARQVTAGREGGV